MVMSEEAPPVVTRDELTEELARLLDTDVDAVRADSESVELGPPWEAEVVERRNRP